jgi:hypothetical protein
MECPNCHIAVEWMDAVAPFQRQQPKTGDSFTCDECKTVCKFRLNKRSQLFLRVMTASEFGWLSRTTQQKILSVGGIPPEGAIIREEYKGPPEPDEKTKDLYALYKGARILSDVRKMLRTNRHTPSANLP